MSTRNRIIGLLFVATTMLIGCTDKDDSSPVHSADVIVGYDWQPDTLVSDSICFSIDSYQPNIVFRKVAVYAGTSPSGGPYYNYFIQAAAMESSVEVTPGFESDPAQQTWNCLDSGRVINQQLTWLNQFNLRANVVMAGAVGIWDTNIAHGFVAIRIRNGALYKYGWFRLQAQFNTPLIIDSYAYNATPGRTIIAGQSR